MKILVTGGAGYIGSILVPKLISRGFNVTVLDNFMYKQKFVLSSLSNCKNFHLIEGDVRDKNLVKNIIKKVDFIIPLAALVGAPICDKNPSEAKEINQYSIEYLSSIADKKTAIIMPTTNSGYGIAEKNKICDEQSPLNPISVYGVTKVNAEKSIIQRENSISLRLATVFGISPRMRLDLLVNHFVYKAITEKKIEIFEGNFKRNYVNIEDVARAFIFCIDNFEKLKSNIFNFGIEDANLTKRELAELIKIFIPDFNYIINEFKEDPDKRNYVVSNKKILSTGFKFTHTLETGLKKLIPQIANLSPGTYTNS